MSKVLLITDSGNIEAKQGFTTVFRKVEERDGAFVLDTPKGRAWISPDVNVKVVLEIKDEGDDPDGDPETAAFAEVEAELVEVGA